MTTSGSDTQVDIPALKHVDAMLENAGCESYPSFLQSWASAWAHSDETLKAGYAAWAQLQKGRSEVRRQWQHEKQRLTRQGELLLGAVREASNVPSAANDSERQLSSIDIFVAETREKLAAAAQALDAGARASEHRFAIELSKVREELVQRVSRQAAALRPTFKLAVRSLSDGRQILHADRLSADESVLALFALNGRIPSRYGFLEDDAVDALTAVSSMLYADEGVMALRTHVTALGHVLSSLHEVWPVKAMLPMRLPDGTWARWVSRGPVLEAEIQEGDTFSNLLSPHQAERIAGLLLSFKLAGKIEMELVSD